MDQTAKPLCPRKGSRSGQKDHELIIGSDPRILRIIEIIHRIAPFDTTVLLTGESGVGKNCYADMIHSLSLRRQEPYVAINCGAIPENLLESELFGYEKGAFTGAKLNGKNGLIETAHRGTLFLDEIGDLPLHMQVKLLKVIQERRITRIGGTKEKEIDFRLIAASNRDIPALVETGTFRKDLFYRLNVIPITIPPLRERTDDIVQFVNYFTVKYNEKYNKSHVFSDQAIELLKTYSWPGNVRELENVVERVILTADSYVITKDMLPTNFHFDPINDNKTLKEILEDMEKKVILETYKKYGTTTKAADVLGISQASVSLKLKKYRQV